MTPDIQELKRLAEAAKSRPLNNYHEPSIDAVNFHRAASPDAILALIEIAEAAEIVHRETMAREYGDRELLVSALARLRTALEGVKK